MRFGNIEFLKLNSASLTWRDAYHWLLTLSWPRFILFLLGAYLGVNVLFALFYQAGGGQDINDMRPSSYADAFFFSVETLATVGYGHLYPVTTYGHIVCTAEILVGLFLLAVMTGLIFVRFSRPNAHIDFSSTMAVSFFNGLPALQIRVANQRRQPLAEAKFRVMLVRNEQTTEGEAFRCFHELPLQTQSVILFPVTMTLRHFINEHSPLHGCTPESLRQSDTRFLASVVGVDTAVHTAVQHQTYYLWSQVRFGERFVEMTSAEGSRITVDYSRFHDTEPGFVAPLPETDVSSPNGVTESSVLKS